MLLRSLHDTGCEWEAPAAGIELRAVVLSPGRGANSGPRIHGATAHSTARPVEVTARQHGALAGMFVWLRIGRGVEDSTALAAQLLKIKVLIVPGGFL